MAIETSVISQKTYLQSCKEDLQPYVPVSYRIAGTFFSIADAAAMCLFFGAAIASLTAAVIFAPIFIPLTAFGDAFALRQAFDLHGFLVDCAKRNFTRAQQISEIQKNYQKIKDVPPEDIQQIVYSKGIYYIPGMWQNDPSLCTLKPLIARYLFWENRTSKLEKQKQEDFTKAEKLEISPTPDNIKQILKLRQSGLEKENDALISKMKLAFTHAVIQRPHFAGTFEDLGNFSNLSSHERSIRAATDDASASLFFTFKKGSTSHITYNQAKFLTAGDLATYMLAAMP